LGATRSVAKNTALLTIGLLTGRCLAVFVTRKMTPLIGPEGVGIFGLATDATAILLIVANYGLNNLVTREVTRAKGMTLPILWATLRLRWTLGLVCYLALVGYVFASPYGVLTRTAVLVTGLAIFVEATSMACDAILQAHEKVQYQSLGQLVSALVYFGLSFWLLDAGWGVMGVIWANLISRIVRLLIMAPLMFLKTGPWRRRGPDGERGPDFRFMLKIGLPLFLATTFGIISFKIDTVMLSSFRGEATAGIYVLGHRALDFLLYLPNIFATAMFPALTRYSTASTADAARFGERTLRYMLVLMIPVTLFFVFVAQPVIAWFSRESLGDFSDSIIVMRVVIWGVPFQSANLVLSRLLLTAGRERVFVRIGLAAMLTNVVLNLLLIPRYSYFGAAAATIASLAVSSALHVRYVRRTAMNAPLRRAVGGAGLALIVAWLATVACLRLLAPEWGADWFALPLTAGWTAFLVAVGMTALLYTILVLALRVLERDDLRLIRELILGSR